MISAAEISQPRDNLCIILVTWDPPANSDAADIDQYIVYVPSRNIGMTVQSSSSPLTTLTVMNCGDDVRVQVAAVNRVGCVGMNSSEVQPVPLDSIPTAPGPAGNGSVTTEGRSATTTEGGTASTSSKHLKLVNLFKLCLAFTAFDSTIITILRACLFLYHRVGRLYK